MQGIATLWILITMDAKGMQQISRYVPKGAQGMRNRSGMQPFSYWMQGMHRGCMTNCTMSSILLYHVIGGTSQAPSSR